MSIYKQFIHSSIQEIGMNRNSTDHIEISTKTKNLRSKAMWKKLQHYTAFVSHSLFLIR